MARVLDRCQDQTVPEAQDATLMESAEEPAEEEAPAEAPAPAVPAPAKQAPVEQAPVAPQAPGVSYGSCAEVRTAGAAPLYAGSPGYSRKLDRDGDGVACERKK